MTKKIILGLALVALCTFAVAISLSPAMAHPVAMMFTEPHAVATNMAMVMLAPMNSRMRGIVSVRANAAIFAQLQASVEEFKSGHKRELNEMNGHIDQLNAQIAALKLGGAADGSGNPEMKQASAAVTEFLRSGKPDAMLNLQPRAGMSSDSGPDGGFTVPTQIDRLIQNQLIALSPMRAATGGGVLVSTSDYKKLINRRGATAGWVGERDPRNETETPLLGEIAPPMGEVYAYPSLTQWMIDDSQFNLETFVAENVTDEFNLQEGSAFAFGDGIKKPRGFLTVPMSEATDSARPFGTWQFIKSQDGSGFPSTAPGDALINLIYAVKPQYRVGPNVGWQMNSATAGQIRKMKDGQGNYLWQEAMMQGEPALLCGYPVWLNEDMPDIGSNALPIAFGNWRAAYLIVDRIGTRIVRDPYTKPGWLRLYISKRVGGAPADSRAVKFLKITT